MFGGENWFCHVIVLTLQEDMDGCSDQRLDHCALIDIFTSSSTADLLSEVLCRCARPHCGLVEFILILTWMQSFLLVATAILSFN